MFLLDPNQLGLCVLNLSKILFLKFHHDFITKMCRDSSFALCGGMYSKVVLVLIIYTIGDTDSLFYCMSSENMVDCRKEDVTIEQFMEEYNKWVVENDETPERLREPGECYIYMTDHSWY
jgi:hypothetical protein